MKKTFVLIVGVIIAVIAFLVLTKPAETMSDPSSHTVGTGTTGVTLIEYGDFQCPACKAYYPAVKDVKAKYGDQITFQFRNFPLESIHINARAGSRAAEAASLQGKFWEMHDKLYEGQSDWEKVGDPLSIFTGYAQSLGLDVEKFKTDYKSQPVNAVINADIKEAQKLGATGTPTFVLNGTKLEGTSATVDSLSQFIDEEMRKQQGTNPESSEQTTQTNEEIQAD